MTTIRLRVCGMPAPQGSKRHVGHGILVEQSTAVGPWREAVKSAAIAAGNPHMPGPVWILATFWIPRPKAHFGTGRNAGRLKQSAPRWCVTNGKDIDKLTRSTLDGLTQAGVIDDDRYVCHLETKRIWQPQDEQWPAGATISIGAL